jgi:glyceraldehyde 3-phosphate dehydrogenase
VRALAGESLLLGCYQGLLGKEIDVVGVVDVSTQADYFAYQMKYDSVHGRFKHALSAKKSSASAKENDVLVVGGDEVRAWRPPRSRASSRGRISEPST